MTQYEHCLLRDWPSSRNVCSQIYFEINPKTENNFFITRFYWTWYGEGGSALFFSLWIFVIRQFFIPEEEVLKHWPVFLSLNLCGSHFYSFWILYNVVNAIFHLMFGHFDVVQKLPRLISEFAPHWVLHTFGLVAQLSYA